MNRTHLQAWIVLALAGSLLILVGAVGLISSRLALRSLLASVTGVSVEPGDPLQPAPLPLPRTFGRTPTPFQPLPPTPTSAALAGPTVPPADSPPIEPSATPPAHFAQDLLAFPSEKAVLRLGPVEGLYGGKNIRIAFTPAAGCPLNSGKACVTAHRSGQVILLTVHSGGGGQGETFRAAVEGASLDSAAFSLAQIHANLGLLTSAPADYKLGAGDWLPLRLAALVRIPPPQVETYMSLPFDDALRLAEEIDPTVRAVLESGEPLLLFEICGWYVPGENWVSGETATSASIYLGFTRLR